MECLMNQEKTTLPSGGPERRQYIMTDRVSLPNTAARQGLTTIT